VSSIPTSCAKIDVPKCNEPSSVVCDYLSKLTGDLNVPYQVEYPCDKWICLDGGFLSSVKGWRMERLTRTAQRKRMIAR
jgi:hypothetical protein